MATYPNGDTTGLWEPRRTLTLEAARRHTVRIKLMRWILIAASLGLLALLVYEFRGQESATLVEADPSEAIVMTNLRYNGKTEDGLPYNLTSTKASQMVGNEDVIELIDPVLHFLRSAGAEESIVVADKGTFDDAKKILNLYTSVDLTTDDGSRCKTTHARVFTKTKVIEGDEPIWCVGSFGTVNGNAYEILDNYSVYVFKNGMDAVLDQ